MALGPRLDLRQSQSLVMTPQLQQAIRLLALSNVEIEAAIAEEIERNPLLEMANDDSVEAPERSSDDRTANDEAFLENNGAGAEVALDVDLSDETVHHDSIADGGSGGSGNADEGIDFDSFAADAPSLHDHLLEQAGAAFVEADMLVATQLIDQIDECGYLQAQPLDIAARLGVPLFRVDAVLAVIHSFDPTGVGARSLGECLVLQAREADRYDPAMACLLDNLDLLAAGRLVQLQRICGVDEEDLADMIRELRSYDPKPGCRFGGARIEAVTPDLFVVERGKGWVVEINGTTLPRLLVNRSYLGGVGQDKASKAWLGDCLANANWLVRALDQRQRTIVRVAEAIVKQQEAFFRKGVAHLRPMTLRHVADDIGMHESTVSRVTSNKYLSCARGVFELKYFFTAAIAAADGGEAASAEAVKNQIRALIAAESPAAILSDDTLVDLLNAKGFGIARRTVAKYREAMGIGSSVQRRRQKAIGARAAA